MSDQCRYLSISDSVRANGDRHKENAERYLAAGDEAFAAGSMRKAERNYAKADELDAFMKRPVHPMICIAYELILDAIIRDIYESPK